MVIPYKRTKKKQTKKIKKKQTKKIKKKQNQNNNKKSKSKSKKIKKGGEVLGKGKDGCIIDSIPHEIYNKSNGYVAKILNKGSITNRELQKKLQEIDPQEKRFARYIFPENTHTHGIGMNEDILICGFSKDEIGEIVFMRKLIPVDGCKLTKTQYRWLRDSLDLLHTKDISHGDLPENIMIDPHDNLPRIIDWENATMNAGTIDKQIDYNAFLTHFKCIK